MRQAPLSVSGKVAGVGLEPLPQVGGRRQEPGRVELLHDCHSKKQNKNKTFFFFFFLKSKIQRKNAIFCIPSRNKLIDNISPGMCILSQILQYYLEQYVL